MDTKVIWEANLADGIKKFNASVIDVTENNIVLAPNIVLENEVIDSLQNHGIHLQGIYANDYRTIDVDQIVALLTGTVKYLSKENKMQKEIISNLSDRLNRIEALLQNHIS